MCSGRWPKPSLLPANPGLNASARPFSKFGAVGCGGPMKTYCACVGTHFSPTNVVFLTRS